MSKRLPPPLALAGSPREAADSVLLCGALAFVLVVELATPATVVGSLALIPILVAAWLLSGRWLTTVGVFAGAAFVVGAVAESQNRSTLLIAGVVICAAAIVTRLYAVQLARLLPPAKALTADAFRGLTPRERQVARLAASGQTAAEIAGRLHIGERTVESHLASTYSKLGIRSKAKLMQMASTLPDDARR